MGRTPGRGGPTGWRLACLLAILLVAGCSPAASQVLPTATGSLAGAPQTGPSAMVVPAEITAVPPSATVPVAAAVGAATELVASPLPTATAAQGGLPLVVLHSNDNWGETEPCG